MVFNRIDRYEYEAVKLEEKDINNFQTMSSILMGGNKETLPDRGIMDHTLKTILAYYIGNRVLLEEITYNPIDSSIRVHIPKEIVEAFATTTETGITVFISRCESKEYQTRNIIGWYDSGVYLQANEE